MVTITVTPRSTMALICDQNSRRRQRIHAGSRLVQEKHRRIVHDGTGQGEALLEAERQLAGARVEIRSQSKRGGHALDLLAAAGPRQPVDAREEVEILAYAQVAVERKLLSHVAHASACRGRGLVKVESGHAAHGRRSAATSRTSS